MVISVTSRFSGKQKTTRKCPTINSRYDVKQVKSEMQALVYAGTCVLLQENYKNFSVLKELCEPGSDPGLLPSHLRAFVKCCCLLMGPELESSLHNGHPSCMWERAV